MIFGLATGILSQIVQEGLFRFNFSPNKDGYMQIVSQKIGRAIIFLVPAIVLGGILYSFTHDYFSVFLLEVLLAFIAGAFIAKI